MKNKYSTQRKSINIVPTKTEFFKRAKQGNVITVYRELLDDIETPVSAFLKISKDQPYAFLLESVEGEEKVARYSFIGTKPRWVWKSRGRYCQKIEGKDKTGELIQDPFNEIEKILKGYCCISADDLPRFQGGLVGYFSYDLVRFCENIPDKNPDPWILPETYLMLVDQMLIFDHAKHKILVVANAILEHDSAAKAYEQAVQKIQRLIKLLKQPLTLFKTKRSMSQRNNLNKWFLRQKNTFKVVILFKGSYLNALKLKSPLSLLKSIEPCVPLTLLLICSI